MWMREVIIATLNGPSAGSIVSSNFPGGVLDRVPKIGTGVTATPSAFWGPENPLEAGKLKNTISVIDGGDNPSPGGAAHHGRVGFPLVYGWVTTAPSGETALAALDGLLHTLFRRGVSYPVGNGKGAEIIVLERQPTRDADDFGYPGREFAIWRLQGTYVSP